MRRVGLEFSDEQHSYLIVELSRARNRQLDTHRERRAREGLHVQAWDDGNLRPVVLRNGGLRRAELDERREPSGQRPGGCESAVELLSLLGVEGPLVGRVSEEVEWAERGSGGGQRGP